MLFPIVFRQQNSIVEVNWVAFTTNKLIGGFQASPVLSIAITLSQTPTHRWPTFLHFANLTLPVFHSVFLSKNSDKFVSSPLRKTCTFHPLLPIINVSTNYRVWNSLTDVARISRYFFRLLLRTNIVCDVLNHIDLSKLMPLIF